MAPLKTCKTAKRARASFEVENGSISKKRKQNDCEDYFSNLPDDLLREIFNKLTHTDLDELSIVSRKISYFASLARPIVEKETMELFEIHYHKGKFEISVRKTRHSQENEKYSLRVHLMKSANPVCEKWKGWKNEMEKAKYDAKKTTGKIAPVLPLTNDICNSIEYLFKRFSCKQIKFFSGLMDLNIMTFFGHIIANVINLNIEFISMINVRREYNEIYYMRVLDWIASLKAQTLYLYFNRQLTGKIYASFLREDNINSQEDFPKVQFPSEEPIFFMAMLRCAEIPTLVLDKISFLQIIKAF
ncbi:hypothetical protein PRIPAC_88839 [Pristionchus pacificus]|uniref:F-box domain-containing protein n=1 Tax=Pristionchus pacificus TaxID=54126 RepID=A0A2A6B962_PRIPA|nr:hypothetical protein PRIPAC_88839 [Pristionchus pacificus]|eukprot:PDM62420.1 F-box domain-containing protein [Pristionchus pacificus]